MAGEFQVYNAYLAAQRFALVFMSCFVFILFPKCSEAPLGEGRFILLVLITLRGVTLRSVIVDILFVERVTESVCGFVSINNSFVQKNSYCLLQRRSTDKPLKPLISRLSLGHRSVEDTKDKQTYKQTTIYNKKKRRGCVSWCPPRDSNPGPTD